MYLTITPILSCTHMIYLIIRMFVSKITRVQRKLELHVNQKNFMKMKKKINILVLCMWVFSLGNTIAQTNYDCLPCISTELSIVDSTYEFHSDSL